MKLLEKVLETKQNILANPATGRFSLAVVGAMVVGQIALSAASASAPIAPIHEPMNLPEVDAVTFYHRVGQELIQPQITEAVIMSDSTACYDPLDSLQARDTGSSCFVFDQSFKVNILGQLSDLVLVQVDHPVTFRVWTHRSNVFM